MKPPPNFPLKFSIVMKTRPKYELELKKALKTYLSLEDDTVFSFLYEKSVPAFEVTFKCPKYHESDDRTFKLIGDDFGLDLICTSYLSTSKTISLILTLKSY